MLDRFPRDPERGHLLRASRQVADSRCLDWADEIQAAYEAGAALADRYMPVVDPHVEGDEPDRTLFLDGPEAWIRRVRERLGEVVEDASAS